MQDQSRPQVLGYAACPPGAAARAASGRSVLVCGVGTVVFTVAIALAARDAMEVIFAAGASVVGGLEAACVAVVLARRLYRPSGANWLMPVVPYLAVGAIVCALTVGPRVARPDAGGVVVFGSISTVWLASWITWRLAIDRRPLAGLIVVTLSLAMTVATVMLGAMAFAALLFMR